MTDTNNTFNSDLEKIMDVQTRETFIADEDFMAEFVDAVLNASEGK